MVDVKIGEYKVIKWKDMLLMVYWTHDGEKQNRIIGHEDPNWIGEVHTEHIKTVVDIAHVDMDYKTLNYWRQFVKLCDL